MTIQITTATPPHLSQITALYNSDKYLFGEDDTGYEEQDVLEYISDPKKIMFIALAEKLVVGALLAEYHDTYAYLDTIIVKKENQGEGIGKLLMEHFENDVKSRGIPLIESLTEVNNVRMQKFFASRDYKEGNRFIFYSKKV